MQSKRSLKNIISIILLGIILMGMSTNIVKGSTLSTSIETNQDSLSQIFVKEDSYDGKMKNIVEPYLKSIQHDGYIKGKKDVSLYYRKYIVQNAKGTIVISHGFAEFIEKYNEMIYYFTKMGYSVYILEHRGHGRSTKLGADISQVNVENFDYYVEDFKTFIDEVVVPSEGKGNLYLYAHSMGGLIAVSFLEQYPGYFKDAVLNSPMLGINSGNVPEFAARLISKCADQLSFGDSYVFGQTKFDGEYNLEESGTSSKERYTYAYKMRIGNKDFQTNGASFRWLSESYNAVDNAIKKSNIKKITIPILMTQSGNDTYVDNKYQNRFAKSAINCKLIKFKKSKHETYRENDDILKPYLVKLFNFYDKQ